METNIKDAKSIERLYLVADLLAVLESGRAIFRETKVKEMSSGIFT